ncbi:MAG: ATP-binding protein, partial [Candidatus Zixiibacteriota bacterium]
LNPQEGEKVITLSSASSVDNRDEIVLTIADNGPGVLPEKVPLLFKKRFTTKRHGHGLGLITCQRIVERHGGRIDYRYEDGAVFSVTLPVSASRPLEPAGVAEKVAP